MPLAEPPSCKIEFPPIDAELFKFPETLSVSPPETYEGACDITVNCATAGAGYGDSDGARPCADVARAAAAYCDFVCSSSGVYEIAAIPSADGINVTRTAVC